MAFGKLRHNISDSMIRKSSESNVRNKLVSGLERALTIGILFGPVEKISLTTIKNFIHSLEDLGKKVFTVGFVDAKELPDYCILETKMNFLSRRDISWVYKPKTPLVDEFLSKDFDFAQI